MADKTKSEKKAQKITDKACSDFCQAACEPHVTELIDHDITSIIKSSIAKMLKDGGTDDDGYDYAMRMLRFTAKAYYIRLRKYDLNIEHTFVYSEGSDEMDAMLCPCCFAQVALNEDDCQSRPRFCPQCGAALNYTRSAKVTSYIRKVRDRMEWFDNAAKRSGDRFQKMNLEKLHPIVKKWICAKTVKTSEADQNETQLRRYVAITNQLVAAIQKYGEQAAQIYLPDNIDNPEDKNNEIQCKNT